MDKNIPDSFDSKTNERLTAFSGDVTSNEDVKSFISDVIATSNQIDIVINNAGIIRDNVIWKMDDKDFDAVCVSVGTGSTISGVIESSNSNQFVLGFLSLKHKKMKKEILKNTSRVNWKLIDDYIFKGYARVNEELINFINDFYKEYKIPLDPIYNSKMVFGIFDMIKKNKWNWGKNILVINSGGLQGVEGMNLKLEERGCETIIF